jgi:methylenetetrahydrofolate dehydrogenase (NADP+)/methenyltetrahydrofolate cyclohydrolase
MITADFVADCAIVVDVGINVDEVGDPCGDVDFDAVTPKARILPRFLAGWAQSRPRCSQSM